MPSVSDFIPGADTAIALEHTAAWVSDVKNWIRVAYVLTGGIIIVAGLVMLIEQTNAGQAATKIAAKAGKTAAEGAVLA